MSYCHNRSSPGEPVFSNEIRIRLYDRNNRMLAEDFLRREQPDTDAIGVVGYLPYREAGHEIRIVTVRARKEAVLDTIPVLSRTTLVRRSEIYGDFSSTRRLGWGFNLDTRCFDAGPVR